MLNVRWPLVTGLLFLGLMSVGCGSNAESASTALVTQEPTEEIGGGGPALGLECSPQVIGLEPASFKAVHVDCPKGYSLREARLAVPIAGRFTNVSDLTDAYCVARGGDQAPPNLTADPGVKVDFEKEDIVAFAYDAAAGEPVLFNYGSDLWLQTISDKCSGVAPTLESIAFVIPKQKPVSEQTCSRRCD